MDSANQLKKYECHICKKEFPVDKITYDLHGRPECDNCLNEIENTRNRAIFRNNLYTLPKKFRLLKDTEGAKLKAQKLYKKSLFLFGESDTGKTVLATFILKVIWNERKKGMFINYPEFVYKAQTEYDTFSDHLNFIKVYPGCLVLDDFGAEKLTDFVRQISYLVINWRESNCLQTVITSNYSLKEINQLIDDRIASRIKRMCEVIRFTERKI